MTSQTGKQTITIDILLDISRHKENQTMESRQFIEYNMGNIFFEKYEKNLVNIENKVLITCCYLIQVFSRK